MAIITISRGTFSGGKAIAEGVAEKLGYQCISREVLVQAAREYGVPLDELSKALTEKPGILNRMSVARAHYLAFIRATLCKDVKDGNVIYHGLAGHLLLRDVPQVLRVKVIASLEFRVQAAMERSNLSRSDAMEFIKRIDEKRDRWVKFLYHVDRNDISTYDLVINLDRISIPIACDIVASNAQQPEYQPTAEWHKKMNDLVKACDIRARIAAEGKITDSDIEIEADGDHITIMGTVNSMEDMDKVKEMVLDFPNVDEISSKLRVRSQW